jgi:competence protein ComEC
VAEEKLIVDFWDVGQGDATVIRLPDGKLVLIDVGPKGSPVIDWLADRRPVIHAAIITHNDHDHAGSLPSLVNAPGVVIDAAYMLLDRDKQSQTFRDIWRPVREQEKRGRFAVVGLAADRVVWQSGGACLKVVYPSFSENIEASKPNESSAVVCLLHQGELRIIWPGDAPMQVVADKCAGAFPDLLHGPHHGGPVDRKRSEFNSWVDSLMPERLFVSVGTNNRYSLPHKPYLNMQASRGVQVLCTQVTRLCDSQHITNGRPVLQTAALLGLRSSRSGVPCRGCMRLTILDGVVQTDPWDAEHAQRVRHLRRPQCVMDK